MISGFFKRLLMARQLDFSEGKIEIFDIKYAMYPISEQAYLHDILIEKFGDKGKLALYESGYNCAKEMAEQLFQKFKVQGLESLSLWQNIIELSGMAKVSTVSNKEPGKILVEYDSALARKMLEKNGKVSGMKADDFLSGFISGVFSKVYGKELDCKEIKCIAGGESACVFLLQTKK